MDVVEDVQNHHIMYLDGTVKVGCEKNDPYLGADWILYVGPGRMFI